jgi:hypothetical protein
MSFLALTAAVSMSLADPQNDLPQDYAIGTPPPIAVPEETLSETYNPPFRERSAMRRQQPAWFPVEQWPTEEMVDNEPSYDEGFDVPMDNGEYWTFDGSGTIPLRYGMETDEGRYEYDLERDEITFRLPGF